MSKKPNVFRQAAGKRLKALRIAKGFDTMRAFANDLGVEEDRYDTWEKGKALIPPQYIEALRQRYGITSDWLYFGDPSGLNVGLFQALKASA